MQISLEQIDKIREQGYRPGVVGVFVNQNKVLLLNKADWSLWLFAQGGIKNNETTMEALQREMTEELGADFVSTWISEPTLILQDRIGFKRDSQNNRQLNLDNGTTIKMTGKHYYYYVIAVESQNLDISQTDFDEYRWLDYDQALELAQTIYQKNKQRALLKVLDLLVESEFIN